MCISFVQFLMVVKIPALRKDKNTGKNLAEITF